QLTQYAELRDEAHFQKFLNNIDVQLGDRQARLEMNKPRPNMAIVREGFVKGGNSVDDVDDLYFLYRQFNGVSYMKSAVQTWIEGDEEILNLLAVGNRMHNLVSAPLPSGPGEAAAKTALNAELASLLNQVYEIDTR